MKNQQYSLDQGDVISILQKNFQVKRLDFNSEEHIRAASTGPWLLVACIHCPADGGERVEELLQEGGGDGVDWGTSLFKQVERERVW